MGWITGGRTDLVLSNRLSGILETASTIVELEYASFPDLSKVSRMVRPENIENTCALYPGNLVTGLLIKSS